MILVKLNRQDFEYDIHSLIKAFYPEEDVILVFPGKELPEREEPMSRCIEIMLPEESADRLAVKNKLKQDLYKRLVKETGKELPWGSLTGIRPVKLALKMLSEGEEEEEISRFMKDTYFCSDEKTALSIEIAKREAALLDRVQGEGGYSLYVGIPFCPSTCLYCSFASYPIRGYEQKAEDYLKALERELTETAKLFAGRRLSSVYIGGGTPTSLSSHQLEWLIDKIKSNFDFSTCLEFTVEAGRPDSISGEKLSVLKAGGVDRISVNPQTFSQKTLDLIGRLHTVEQTAESYKLAREYGFENINMDLIIGLPGETASDVKHTMEKVAELAPDDVTVHALAVKRGSRLKLQLEEYRDQQAGNMAEEMEIAEKACRSIGRTPYYLYRQKNIAGNFENTGYASPGKEGIYNVLMMEEVQDILAVGAGTVSKRVYPEGTGDGNDRLITRCDTVKDLDLYISRIDEMVERKRKLFGTEG